MKAQETAWNETQKETTDPRATSAPIDKGKWLQIQLTIEDEGAFTVSAIVSYGTRLGARIQRVCAENRFRFFFAGREAAVSTAKTPDFGGP
jgi:hypothetical protein